MSEQDTHMPLIQGIISQGNTLIMTVQEVGEIL